MLTLTGPEELQSHVGEPIGRSPWHTITQAQVDAFAEITGDKQWIHVDPVRAANSPFGSTIVHGYFTLALAPAFLADLLEIRGFAHGVNYGLNKVRFPSPCPVGSRVRMGVILSAVDSLAGAAQVTMDLEFEREGSTKPVCVAQWIGRYFL
jgi:acyl dehydratase